MREVSEKIGQQMDAPSMKWLVSGVAGLVIGILASMVGSMFTPVSADAVAPASVLDRHGTLIVMLVIAAGSTFILERCANMTRRIGWACVIAGLLCFLMLLALLFFSSFTLPDAFHATEETRDQATAFFFLLLFFGLPSLLGGIAFTAGGALLLRRGSVQS